MARRTRTEAGASEQKRHAFLEALAECGNVTRACAKAGLARASAYAWRTADGAFAAAWQVALDIGVDALEDEAVRRAVEGEERPVYHGGKMVGTLRNYSDTLLMFLLKARRPEKFKDRPAHADDAASDLDRAKAELDRRLDRLAAALAKEAPDRGADG